MTTPELLHALRDPAWLAEAGLDEWDMIIRQGRNSGLLARLDELVKQAHVESDIPAEPARHLQATRRLSDKQASVVRYEVACLQQALDEIKQPLILLKGAAYVMADLPPAAGRLFSDIDLLVPKSRLDEVEQALMQRGWQTSQHDEYYQRYYRTWMHELPPMQHEERMTVIDVHHTILPETARLHPDPEKLLAAIVPVQGQKNMYVLAPTDMVLHSATHLFHDGELEHGLRDLVDLDALLRHFATEKSFWDALVERAAELDLGRPLYYALRYTREFLQTPVPEVAMKAVSALAKPVLVTGLMDRLLRRALMPPHPGCEDWFTPRARWLLYVRSHYLRMPLHLLLPHLLRKALVRRDLLITRQTHQEKMRQMLLDDR